MAAMDLVEKELKALEDAEPAPLSSEELKWCNLCRKNHPKSKCTLYIKARKETHADIYRCRSCNALSKRMNGLFSDNQDLKLAFAEMPLEDKTEIMNTCHELMGNELKMAITDKATVMLRQKVMKTQYGKGKFYDEQDLRKLYKDKPGDADNILKNSYSFMCPIKKKRLYEDIEYSSERITSMEKLTIRELLAQVESERKKPKKVQKEPKDKDGDKLEEGGVTKLLPKQASQLEKSLKSIEESSVEFGRNIDIANHASLTEYIPKYMTNKSKLLQGEIGVFTSTVQLILDEKKIEGEAFKDHMNTFKDLKPKILECQKKLKQQIDNGLEELGMKIIDDGDGKWDIRPINVA